MEELQTFMGTVRIYVDGRVQPFKAVPLPLRSRCFSVDMRWLLRVKAPENRPCHIACLLELEQGLKQESFVETGERLALISFVSEGRKLSLSTIGDVPQRKYLYPENGLEVILNDEAEEEVYFVAAGKMMLQGEDGIETWLAADVDSILAGGSMDCR